MTVRQPVAVASLAGKSRHSATEPRPSCSNTSVGVPARLAAISAYSIRCPMISTNGKSNSEMPLQQRRIGLEPRRRASKGNASLDQEHGAVGDGAERSEILVKNDAGGAAVAQLPDDRPDFFGDARRQTFGGLVEHDQVGIGHQRASDGQHLLFTAR